MDEEKKYQDSLEENRQYWSKQYGKELSLEEVQEINDNLCNFFELLMKWDEAEKSKQSTE